MSGKLSKVSSSNGEQNSNLLRDRGVISAVGVISTEGEISAVGVSECVGVKLGEMVWVRVSCNVGYVGVTVLANGAGWQALRRMMDTNSKQIFMPIGSVGIPYKSAYL